MVRMACSKVKKHKSFIVNSNRIATFTRFSFDFTQTGPPTAGMVRFANDRGRETEDRGQGRKGDRPGEVTPSTGLTDNCPNPGLIK